MSFETHQIYHGFKCIHQENIKELNSVALQFEHVKTGARIVGDGKRRRQQGFQRHLSYPTCQ